MRRARLRSALLLAAISAVIGIEARAETCDVDSGRPEAVIAACNKKIDSWFLDNDAKANGYFNRGLAHSKRRDYDAAIADFSEVIRLRPADACGCDAHNARGWAYQQKGDLRRAEADYRRALEINPKHERARANLANLEKRMVEPADAQSRARRETEPRSDEQVRRAQELLRRLAKLEDDDELDPGEPDGRLGRKTIAAIRYFRSENGLPGTGTVDPPLLAALATEVDSLSEDKSSRSDRAKATIAPEPVARPEKKPGSEPSVAALAPKEKVPPASVTDAQAVPRDNDSMAEQPAPAALPTEKRVALVVGNSAYRQVPQLVNPLNDATDMAAMLERLGFRVLKGIDLDRLAIEDLTIRFAEEAGDADIAIAYYAGHGIQLGDRNYLLPIDAAIRSERDVRRLFQLDTLIEDAGRARRLAMVLVDACRDNPFLAQLQAEAGLTRTTAMGRGLARPQAIPRQMLIAYATQEKFTAEDGTGRNSPFTAALLQHFPEPGLEVRLMFGRVRDAVLRATDGRQQPPIFGALGGEPIYIVPPKGSSTLALDDLDRKEVRALQRSLASIGRYDGPIDGATSSLLRTAVKAHLQGVGATETERFTTLQLVELHRLARFKKPPTPLPQLDLIDVIRRSESGDKEAQLLRGMIHDSRFAKGPMPKDTGEASRWYRKAAEQGSAKAAANLGRILKDAEGPLADPVEAARWLMAAIADGSAETRNDPRLDLVDLYLEGRGVRRDPAEAKRLLDEAAAQADGGEAMTLRRHLGPT